MSGDADRTGLDSRLREVVSQYEEVQAQLATPEVSTDPDRIRTLGRELSRLEPVVAAFRALAEKEGILCAFESAHALAHALKLAADEPQSVLLVGLSGRGDKDVGQAQALLGPSA